MAISEDILGTNLDAAGIDMADESQDHGMYAWVKMNAQGSSEVIQEGVIQKTFGHVNPTAYSDACRFQARLNMELEGHLTQI